jgi:hypothetical protein
VALVLVGTLLTGTLFGATAAIGADRTAFDGEYTSNTFEEEGVYTEMTAEIRENVTKDIDEILDNKPRPQGVRLTLTSEQIAEQGVTEEFVGGEMDRVIGQLYQYLHDERDDLDIQIDLAPMKTTVSETIVDGIAIDTPTLVGSKSDRVDSETIAQLSENESAYKDAQVDLPPGERESISEELETNVRAELSDEDEALTAAVLDHQQTVLDGLTGEITYEEYVDQLATNEQRIKEELAASAVADVQDQGPAFGEDDDPEAAFAPFQRAIQWGTTATWLLPLLSVGLVGLGYAVSRSKEQTASMTAGALLLAGITGILVGWVVRPVFIDRLRPEEGDPGPLFDGLVGVVDGTLGTIGQQSVILVLAGVVVFAVIFADRQGKLLPVREQLGMGPRAEVTGAAEAGDETKGSRAAGDATTETATGQTEEQPGSE